MPIDPFAALNAMVRAEAARSHETEERRPAERNPDAAEAAPESRRPVRDDGAA